MAKKRPNGEKLGRISVFQLLKKSRYYYYLFLTLSILLALWLCAREVKSDFTLGKPILWFAFKSANVFFQLLLFLILFILLLLIFMVAFLNRIFKKEYEVINQKLINLTDISGYVSILESFYPKKLEKTARIFVNNNLAVGYMELGRFEEALILLEENLQLVNINYNRAQPYGIMTLNNLTELYCRKRDVANAQHYFGNLTRYEPKIKNTIHYGKYMDYKSALEHQINVISGDSTSEDEKFFLKKLDGPLPYQKNHSLLNLALIYIKDGEMQKYRECLEKITISDKDLHLVKTVQKMLEELDKSEDIAD